MGLKLVFCPKICFCPKIVFVIVRHLKKLHLFFLKLIFVLISSFVFFCQKKTVKILPPFCLPTEILLRTEQKNGPDIHKPSIACFGFFSCFFFANCYILQNCFFRIRVQDDTSTQCYKKSRLLIQEILN